MLHLGEEDEEEEEESVWILSISLVLTDYLQFVHNGEAAKVGVELPHSFHLLLLVHLHKRQRTEGKINPQRFHKNKMLLIRVFGEMNTDLKTVVDGDCCTCVIVANASLLTRPVPGRPVEALNPLGSMLYTCKCTIHMLYTCAGAAASFTDISPILPPTCSTRGSMSESLLPPTVMVLPW